MHYFIEFKEYCFINLFNLLLYYFIINQYYLYSNFNLIISYFIIKQEYFNWLIMFITIIFTIAIIRVQTMIVMQEFIVEWVFIVIDSQEFITTDVLVFIVAIVQELIVAVAQEFIVIIIQVIIATIQDLIIIISLFIKVFIELIKIIIKIGYISYQNYFLKNFNLNFMNSHFINQKLYQINKIHFIFILDLINFSRIKFDFILQINCLFIINHFILSNFGREQLFLN